MHIQPSDRAILYNIAMIQQKAAEIMLSLDPSRRMLDELQLALKHAEEAVSIFRSLADDKSGPLPYDADLADQRARYGEGLLRKAPQQIAKQEEYESETAARVEEARRLRAEEQARIEAAAAARKAEIDARAAELAEARRLAREEVRQFQETLEQQQEEEAQRKVERTEQRKRRKDRDEVDEDGNRKRKGGKKRKQRKENENSEDEEPSAPMSAEEDEDDEQAVANKARRTLEMLRKVRAVPTPTDQQKKKRNARRDDPDSSDEDTGGGRRNAKIKSKAIIDDSDEDVADGTGMDTGEAEPDTAVHSTVPGSTVGSPSVPVTPNDDD